MSSADPVFIALFFGFITGLTVLTAAEIAAMRLLSIADRPKYIWYPIVANLATFFIVIIVAGLFAALIAMGLIVAMGSGYDSAENLLTLSAVSPLLVPVVAFVVRFVLFLLMKLGKEGKALAYAVASMFVSLAGVALVTAALYLAASLSGVV